MPAQIPPAVLCDVYNHAKPPLRTGGRLPSDLAHARAVANLILDDITEAVV